MRMMSLIVVMMIAISGIRAQSPVYDSLAIKLLDRMSDILGDLTSCAITVNISQEAPDPDYVKLSHFTHYEVKYSGNNKFLVRSQSDKDDAGYWYNGSQLFYYSFKRNQYGLLNTNGETTLEVMDMVNKKYGVEFPAVDFFYPGLTDDLIAQTTRIEFFGLTHIGEQPCYKIAAIGPDLQVELWLKRDIVTLPVFMVVLDRKNNNLRYEAHYSEWDLNKSFPDAIFDFVIPPDATPLTVVPKS